MPASSYFTRIDDRMFQATQHVSGAWNIEEQHVAPSFGLLVHAVERDHAARRASSAPGTAPLVLGRASFDIYGTFTLDPVEIDVRVLRPGRSIELVEAQLSQGGRTAIVLRAWLMQTFDTSAIEGIELPSIASREGMTTSRIHDEWPGDAVQSIDVVSTEERFGRAQSWVRPKVAILDEPVSATARSVGMLDFSNGLTPREPIGDVAFPNLDLTATFVRQPSGDWQGYDTSVTFGANGIGVTHTVLHDEAGPFGVMTQCLTVRPLR